MSQSFFKFLIIFFITFIFKFSHLCAQVLVDADWLENKICNDNIVVLEIHRGKKNYELGHIPCSVYTNFYEDGWRSARNNIPMALPSENDLKRVVEQHGISNEDRVIIAASGTGKYDAAESTSIYYTLKYLGHENLSILNGGVPAWKASWDRDIETGYKKPKMAKYLPKINHNIYADKNDVLDYLKKNKYLIDARSTDMYLGINNTTPSSRYGTIKGAINIPNKWLLKNSSLFFHNKKNLKKIFDFVGINDNEGQISFCNAGLESSILWFVLSEILEYPNSKLYESSLAEWSKELELPMENSLSLKFEVEDNTDENFNSMKPN